MKVMILTVLQNCVNGLQNMLKNAIFHTEKP